MKNTPFITAIVLVASLSGSAAFAGPFIGKIPTGVNREIAIPGLQAVDSCELRLDIVNDRLEEAQDKISRLEEENTRLRCLLEDGDCLTNESETSSAYRRWP